MQPTLLVNDAPRVVQSAVKKLNTAKGRVESAEAAQESLQEKLEEARGRTSTKRADLTEVELVYLMACCEALQRELEKTGQGYCHACGELVDFGGYFIGQRSQVKHIPYRSGREYQGSTEAYDETHYYYYHVPHRCPVLNQAHGNGIAEVKCNLIHPSYYRHGGTIADAPGKLFTQYGIPVLDPGMLNGREITPWDFPHEIS